MRSRQGVAFVVTNIAFFWLATALAACSLWPIYQTDRFLVVVAAGLVLGTAIGVVGAALRWPAWAVVVTAFAGFLVVGVPVAVPDKTQFGVLPTIDGLLDLVAGVALGWRQLLTITLPVGSYQALLVPAFVLVLAGTTAGVSIAVRARYGELAALFPATLFVVGILFGPEVVPWPVPLALGMFATLLLWFVWRRSRRRRAAIRLLAEQTPDARTRPLETASDRVAGARTLVAGGLILVLAAGASVAASLTFPPTGDRDVLRTSVEQPFDPRDYASPLAGLRSYLRDGADQEVMLRVVGLPADGRIRIATLDSYDGVVYAVGSPLVDSASGTFVRVPTEIDRPGDADPDVAVDVTVAGYRGVWVPTVGDLERIEFFGESARLEDSFYFNQTTGTGAVLDGLGEGDTYRLQAIDRPEAVASLDDLTPGTARVPRLGDTPDELTLKLEEYAGDVTSAGGRLSAAIDGLRSEGYISHGLGEDEPPSRSGHAADRITELLASAQMIGDAEQYSVAGALMARELGFPARVVFGFAPSETAGMAEVTGDDITAWIEVSTAERGWVAVDPVPPVRPIPADVEEEPQQVARPQSPVQPPPEDPDTREQQSPPDSTQDDPDTLDPFLQVLFAVLRIAGGVLLGALVLASPFLVVIGAKLRRRRLRRRAPTPVQRISGGWDEFHDAMVDRGYSPPPAATRSEIALASPLEQSRTLAAVADRAVFAPGEPDAAEADRVWRVVGELRGHLDRGRTRRQRLKALISVRSLGGYSVRNLFTR